MRISDNEDRLIDALLDEVLGGQSPPDVTDRVLARARLPERRIVRLGARVLAAAVVMLAVLAAYLATGERYPEPTVASGRKLARGASLLSGESGETLHLGNYCSVTLQPGTALQVEGAKRAEGVYLERGEVLCDVDSSVGTFCVRTEIGKVSVTGTKFRIALEQEEDAEMRMLVKVLVGSVVVLGLSGQEYALSAEGNDQVALGEQTVPLDKVPEVVKAAALKAVAGIVLKEAEKCTKDAAVVYELDGVADGKEYEITVLSTGKVLRVKLEDDDDDVDDEDDDADDEDDDDGDDDDDEDEEDDDEHDEDDDDDDEDEDDDEDDD